jgi:hypothetical protein
MARALPLPGGLGASGVLTLADGHLTRRLFAFHSTSTPKVAEACVLCAPCAASGPQWLFSARTWLNSVLSLCAPHWGQRSADDHAPHRGHALCLRFGTTALPVHRCRISRLLEHPNEVAPKQVD